MCLKPVRQKAGHQPVQDRATIAAVLRTILESSHVACRHGIMLVGPAGAGKSAVAECLAAALTELGTKHVIWRMNPKVGPWSRASCS